MKYFYFQLGCLFLSIAFIPSVAAKPSLPHMNVDELACLEKMIFQNECSEQVDKMLAWNTDEDFPSFGIGHFIWYPQNKKGPYKDTFPDFLSFLEAQKVGIPEWIKALPNREAPWANRDEFERDLESKRMKIFRDFLVETMGFQTQFMLQRIQNALLTILGAVSPEQRFGIEQKFYLVADAPKGIFALIDYVNFKGEGVLETERSQGQGWGLFHVFEEMDFSKTQKNPLTEFVRAANEILEKRVRNSLPEEDRSNRLRGWKNRVNNYLKIRC